MKKLVGLAVVLAALILGSYYGMGLVTERTLKKNIAMINQSNGLVIDIEQYHRGWFRSNAMLNCTLHVPSRTDTTSAGVVTTIAAQDYKMKVPLLINHGPVMFVAGKPYFGLGYAHSDLTLPQPYAEQFSQEFTPESIPPLLKVNIHVNFLNNSMIGMELLPFKLISKADATQFEWLGLGSKVNVSSNRANVKGLVSVNGLSLSKNNINATLGKVHSDYDMHRTDLGMYLGDANLSFASLTVTKADQKALDVQNVDVHSKSGTHDGLLDSHLNITLDKLSIDAQNYGPVLLDLSIKNIDAVVLAKINEQSEKLQQGTDAERQQMLITMLPELPKLLSKGATFDISALNIGMPEGTIKGTLSVSLPKMDASNPFQLIQAIEGQGKVTIPSVLIKRLLNDDAKKTLLNQAATQPAVVTQEPKAETTPVANDAVVSPAPVSAADIDQQARTQADARLATLVGSGLLAANGSDFIIEFKLTHGQLSVNGKPFNPAMMQF